MPAGGLGSSLLRAKKKKAEASKAHYKDVLKLARETENQSQSVEPEAKKLKSIWQTSNMDDFLSIATEREQGFQAERNVRVVVGGTTHVVTNDKVVPLTGAARDWQTLTEKLPIPRRPPWTFDMSADEIQVNEKKMFLDWRRGLSKAEELEKVVLTPYEKNLEVWRQLWRVVERSDVVLQIVDSRNPLAFRSTAFERYVSEHKAKNGKAKQCLLLLNKADLLTQDQRQVWAQYLQSKGIQFFFFSASENLYKQQQQHLEESSEVNPLPDDESSDEELEEEEEEVDEEGTGPEGKAKQRRKSRRKGTLRGVPHTFNPFDKPAPVEKPTPSVRKESEAERQRDARIESGPQTEPWEVLSPEQLLDKLAALRVECGVKGTEPITVGLVGYPNVGKSSSINAIIGCKKVVVSATPGKTKHFQTLPIPGERRVILCDCPGLVFPSFAANKDSMICDGILPIDTVKDYVAPVALLAQRIQKKVLEAVCAIEFNPSLDVDDSSSPAELLLNLFARRRGYMSDHDKPNRSRAARELLKLYVDGELTYVHPPPGYRPPTSASPPIEEEPGSEDSDADWEDISSAEDARALSDDDEPRPKLPVAAVPYFCARPPNSTIELTPEEAFNAVSNDHLLSKTVVKFAKTKKSNPQLEEDPRVFFHEDGTKEILIDSDDGIVELGAVPGKEKVLSKRQQRRLGKRVEKSSRGAKLVA
jgi:large subunit GTPase 1